MRGSTRMGTTVASCRAQQDWSRNRCDFSDNNYQGTDSYFDEADMTS